VCRGILSSGRDGDGSKRRGEAVRTGDEIPKGRGQERGWHRAAFGSIMSSLAFPFFHRRFVLRFFLFFKKIPNLQCCIEEERYDFPVCGRLFAY